MDRERIPELPSTLEEILEDEETEKMTFAVEESLEKAGSWGLYQKVMCILLSVTQVFAGTHAISAVFVSATPKHTCYTPDSNSLTSVFEKLSIPIATECTRYKHNYPALSALSFSSIVSTNDLLPFLSNETEPCSSWNYDSSVYTSTAVTEWNLLCSRRWLKTMVQVTFMIGVLVGAAVYGQISDRFGRRAAILGCAVSMMSASIGTAFVQDFGSFLALRFIVAASVGGIMVVHFVLMMEIIKPESRTFVGIFNGIPFGIGISTLAGFSYLIRDWRNLHICLGASSAIMLVYFLIVPETPRWLVSQGRPDDALKVLKTIAKINKKKLPPDEEMLSLLKLGSVMAKDRTNKTKTEKIFQVLTDQWTLVQTPILRRRNLINFFIWFASAMIYYGLIFYSANISGDPFILVIVSGFIEIPGFVLAYFTLIWFGRRKTSCALFFLTSATLAVLMTIPLSYTKITFGLATLGKCFDIAVFQLAYLYTAELVPTHVRNIALGTCSTFGRVGSAIAPFIIDFSGELHYTVPMLIFSLLSLIAGLTTLLLPETMNKPLPQTVREIESKEK